MLLKKTATDLKEEKYPQWSEQFYKQYADKIHSTGWGRINSTDAINIIPVLSRQQPETMPSRIKIMAFIDFDI
ncbi:MAG: hypothetical protein RIG62_09775 [Cyclobacteriaceae bacterium]